MFNAAESTACAHLVELALREDLGPSGDLTSMVSIPAGCEGRASIVARQPGVVAGLPAAALVFAAVDVQLRFQELVRDGGRVQLGTILATIDGPVRGILAAERTALNVLQYLSGIATLTRRYVDAVAGLRSRILDTRKTLPGWRLLAKYAVRQGGGHNHRMGLFDGILLKDNHLAFRADENLANLLRHVRKELAALPQKNLPITIEVDTLQQLDQVLPEKPDIVLLDNMTLDQLREAVRRRDLVAPRVLLEASGGVNLQTVRAIAETGVDRISVGALTHSAPALDIALDYGG